MVAFLVYPFSKAPFQPYYFPRAEFDLFMVFQWFRKPSPWFDISVMEAFM